MTFTFCPFTPRWRRGAACWASRRCVLGVLAIQRVDGPSLAMSTHPSNSSSFLGQLFGSFVGAMSQATGVFRDSPRARRRAGGGLRRSSLAAALGQDSSTRWRSGTRDTLNVASGLVSSQSAFVFEFVDQGCVAAVPFFSRKSLRDLRVESPGAGRGPARPRPVSRKTRRLN